MQYNWWHWPREGQWLAVFQMWRSILRSVLPFILCPFVFIGKSSFKEVVSKSSIAWPPHPTPAHLEKYWFGIDFSLHLPWLGTASENKQAFSWNHLNISDNYRKLTIGRWDCFAIDCRRRGSNGALQRWGKLSHNWLHPPMEKKHRKICNCCSGYSPTVRH